MNNLEQVDALYFSGAVWASVALCAFYALRLPG
jgi:hypothetical protein